MSNRDEVKLHRLSKYRKLDPLLWDFAPSGALRLRRWRDGLGYSKPNAAAMEDLPGGSVVVVDVNGGFAEVRLRDLSP